jgi:mono/diheme cytochrome c family protein
LLLGPAFLITPSSARGAEAAAPVATLPESARNFIDDRCSACHDDEEKKGGLDLTSLAFKPADAANFAEWVKVFERVSAGEMPPKKKPRPPAAELATFTHFLETSLVSAEQARLGPGGRATQRRLNRYEYENALRDLLHAPWLQVRDSLPEDGEAFRFNKVGDALDVSHVQLARYLGAADYALRQVMLRQVEKPAPKIVRYYARDQVSYTKPMIFTEFNTSPERATFPVLGFQGQPDVRIGKAPISAGPEHPEERELEGVGVVAGSYEPIEPKFNQFRAPIAGHYKLRFNGFTVWAGPGKPEPVKTEPGKPAPKPKPTKWWIPDLDDISAGHRSEPVTIYSELPPRLLRQLGGFDLTPQPGVKELDVWLLQNEMIRPDAGRLFRSRPGASRFQNPLAQPDGQPGIVFRWLEVEGPIYDEWPTAGHKLLFGDLPLKKAAKPNLPVEVVSAHPDEDARRLLRHFIAEAYRRPVPETETERFLPVITNARQTGSSFADAMIAGYTAVLCSPEFICLEEAPGKLDDFALASRLSFFLWNSPPDAELRSLAAKKELHRPKVLAAQTERLLADPKSARFVNAFLDYWLDLRKITATAPDSSLYPDYYLDDLLQESALEETQRFFGDLIARNLPARDLVSADFTWLNERLATHYGLPATEGIALHRVTLPADSVRGGLLTQAAILKVTSNGTTTSPVIRGSWIMERILGRPPPPPPPSVPALDPDTRGAATIRQQLEKHRADASCSACHANFDPAGFALENFDVMGGWRERYRALDGTPDPGIGKGGQKFLFHQALPVDSSGELVDGRTFSDIRSFKTLLLENEDQIARNLVRQLVVYSTGARVRFSDRAAVEKILQETRAQHYAVRSLIGEIVQSPLFLEK